MTVFARFCAKLNIPYRSAATNLQSTQSSVHQLKSSARDAFFAPITQSGVANTKETGGKLRMRILETAVLLALAVVECSGQGIITTVAGSATCCNGADG